MFDPAPKKTGEFIAACIKANQNEGKLCVVSHAWSFYLAKRRAVGNRVWTLRFTGQKNDGSWRSGTTIAQIKKTLENKNKTFASSPTMEYASIGSWIATLSHGHPGTITALKETVEWAIVLNLLNYNTEQRTPQELLAIFGSSTLRTSYVVISVKIATVENEMVERFAFKVDSINAVDKWIRGEYVRIMFIGTAGPLGIVWNKKSVFNRNGTKHMHPHCCGAFCFWLTVDCLPSLPCASLGDLTRFDGFGTLSTANSSINPPFYPIFSIWGQICCVYNLELLIPIQPDATKLYSIVTEISNFHKNYTGRTELRMNNDTLFLDISMRSIAKLKLYFGMLFTKFKIDRAAQHPGKFTLDDLSPIKNIEASVAMRPLSGSIA